MCNNCTTDHIWIAISDNKTGPYGLSKTTKGTKQAIFDCLMNYTGTSIPPNGTWVSGFGMGQSVISHASFECFMKIVETVRERSFS
jgi:hypothetical protein